MEELTLLQEVVAGAHPSTDLAVAVPIGALLVWAGKILYNVTVAQKEMIASLFGTAQAPGAIPRLEQGHKALSKRIHRVRDDVQAIAVATGAAIRRQHDQEEDEESGP